MQLRSVRYMSFIPAASVIAYGKGGEIACYRRAEQEMFVPCLCILQSASPRRPCHPPSWAEQLSWSGP